MEQSTQSVLVGEQSQRNGIHKTIQALQFAGNEDTVREIEIEELESRGINPYWNRVKFRNELVNQAKENDVWFEDSYLDDKVLLHDQKVTGTSENDVYKNSDGKTLTKLNNLSYVKGIKHTENLSRF
jgi:hypothetical protein